jgi:hypothetical protein
VKTWQQAGQQAQASAALWGLVVVALVVLLPYYSPYLSLSTPHPTWRPSRSRLTGHDLRLNLRLSHRSTPSRSPDQTRETSE